MRNPPVVNSKLRLLIRCTAAAGMLMVLMPPAASGEGNKRGPQTGLQAVPFVFVGKAGDCGAGYPAGSNIVTSAWLGGMGLPDNGGPNSSATDPQDAPNKNDPHFGLLLSKNGQTPNCSSAGARIFGAEGMVLTELGFDYRNGGHCGGGAPRFNVVVRNSVTNTDTFYFVGNCTLGLNMSAPQDPLEWTRLTFSPAAFGIPPGSRIRSITLIYDEGTDQSSAPTALSLEPSGVGLAVVDNININGSFIRRGSGIAPAQECADCDRDGKHDDKDDGGDGDRNDHNADNRH